MSTPIQLEWTDENGDKWLIDMQMAIDYGSSARWEVTVVHGNEPVCDLVITTISEAYPPKLRDVAESMAHYFCSVALKMVEAG